MGCILTPVGTTELYVSMIVGGREGRREHEGRRTHSVGPRKQLNLVDHSENVFSQLLPLQSFFFFIQN